MSRMLVKGLLHYRLPVTELRAIVESAANLEVAGMEKGLSHSGNLCRNGHR